MADKDLGEMDVDSFMTHGLDSLSEDEEDDVQEEESDSGEEEEEEVESSSTTNGPPKKASTISKHKKSLEKLKEQDPEFYEFLQKEDQELLNFDDSDSSDGDDDDEEEEAEGEGGKSEKKFHKPPEKLEVASDSENAESESDEEEVKEQAKTKSKKQGKLVTVKMVNQWSAALQEHHSVGAVESLIYAFKAAVQQAADGGESSEPMRFRVEGSQVFNAIVRVCIQDLPDALEEILAVPLGKDEEKQPLPATSKKWKKLRLIIKTYLTDLLQLAMVVSDASMKDILFKHILKLILYFISFPKLAKILMKKLITIWSSAEESTRVIAFLGINKLCRRLNKTMLEPCIKQMYMAYVKNCKFTSPTTLPLINFMQRALVEMFSIDANMTYNYAFIYIRQLAIHLRNAITMQKKDTVQAVYNWQYVHCLHLWVRLISTTYPNSILEPLIYPLTQVIIGTIKLIPTERYYPVRFHCVRALTILSRSTDTFIPVLPFLLEVFENTDFNKRPKSVSWRPFTFACILKLSKAQIQEKAFKDGVIDQLYELMMDQFNVQAHTIAFPELALPAQLQLKGFLKKCKIANYTKQIKQILDKVEETSKVISLRRKTVSFNISDATAVAAWERRSKEEGTPISKYHATWRKLRDRELVHEVAGKDRISMDEHLPQIIRDRGPKRATEEEKKEFAELFDSGSEDEDDDTRFLLKEERPKKVQKTTEGSSDEDDYSDFDSDELEQLAGSADDDDDDDEEEDDDEDDGEEDDDDEDISADDDDDDDVEDDEEEAEEEEEVDDGEEEDDVVEDFKLSDSDGDEDDK